MSDGFSVAFGEHQGFVLSSFFFKCSPLSWMLHVKMEGRACCLEFLCANDLVLLVDSIEKLRVNFEF